MEQPDKVVGRETAGCAIQGGAEMSAKVSREPRFDELGIEQKINRLRDALLSLSVMGERASLQASEANRIAKEHDHGSGGQVVVPLDGPRNLAILMEGGEGPFRRVQRLLG